MYINKKGPVVILFQFNIIHFYGSNESEAYTLTSLL